MWVSPHSPYAHHDLAQILSSALVTTSTQLPNLNPLVPNSRHTDIGTRSVVLNKIIEIPRATHFL
jgi:hypothetical protein